MTELLFPAAASAGDIREIERTCDRFEAAWFEAASKGGRRPSLEDYLDRSAEQLQPALLCHLLALEWEYRLRAGDRPRVAEYEFRFPAVGSLIEEIHRDLAARARCGPPARLEKYRLEHDEPRQRVALQVLPASEMYWRKAAPARQPSLAQRVGRWGRRNPILAAAICSGAIALAAAAGWACSRLLTGQHQHGVRMEARSG